MTSKAKMEYPTGPFQKMAIQNSYKRTMELKLLARKVFNMMFFSLQIFVFWY